LNTALTLIACPISNYVRTYTPARLRHPTTYYLPTAALGRAGTIRAGTMLAAAAAAPR